jgi:hypothetical protein
LTLRPLAAGNPNDAVAVLRGRKLIRNKYPAFFGSKRIIPMSDNRSPSFLARFPLYPRDNKEQAVRIRRFFMAAGTYAMAFILGFVQSGLGIMEVRPLYFLLIIVTALLFIYYLLFRTGANLHFRDPSLTALQMYTATLVLM